MMATATPPPNNLRLGRTSYASDDVGYNCRMGPVAKERVKVKKRKRSPPRLSPPPPPPPGQSDSISHDLTQDELGSPAVPLQAQVEPLGTDEDELESFKKLGLIVSPHKLEPESSFYHPESDSKSVASSPDQDYPANDEAGYVSVHRLNTEAALGHTVQTAVYPCPRHLDTTVNDATSPSPLPLPEPDIELESPVSPCIARYQPRDNLNSCGVDDQERFDCKYSPPPCMGDRSILPLSRTVSDSLQDDMSFNGGLYQRDYFGRDRLANTCHSPEDDLLFDEEYGRMAQEENSDEGSEEENEVMSMSCPTSSCHHQPVSRQLPGHQRLNHGVYGRPFKSVGLGTTEPMSTSLPLGPLEEEPQNDESVMLVCPEETPQFIGTTKPVPPPRQSFITSRSSSPPRHSTRVKHAHTKALQSTMSSPALLSSDKARPRSVSFLQCKAGDDCGSFPADYLGSREIDCYVGCVNTAAKQLVDSKPVEVIAYVSSKKVRLAPPRNAALLFKSFAMKDILAVEMCTKNKWIVGFVVWKKGQPVPVCHVLRCQTNLVSNSLYDSLLYQTQQVDEVTKDVMSTVADQPNLSSSDTRPPSDMSFSSSDSEHAPSPQLRNHTPTYRDALPLSPTDPLHKFPAVYVGSAGSGKLHSVNDVIQKVLTENKPSQSKEVSVWLSLSQLRHVETKAGGEEIVSEAHETSRIRAIGVCSRDKRYIGYIIKEEGKPLTGHVLRCNSAGLMVSLMSFLRQSCQMMVYQRGGSFYDELSADDSEDYDMSMEGSTSHIESSGLVKRIRSLTMSISHRTAVSLSTQTHPSFQSHTSLRKQLSPASDIPAKKRDSVQNSLFVSPQNYTEEDYAKFSVTYVGSATLYLPFTKESVLDALKAFDEDGISAGQAAVTKNVIDMQISALSISLTDKTHKLFVTRNYPRKQVEGFCVHPKDTKYFAFATHRPGFPTSMKVHVFARGEEPSSQIVDAIKFWLEIEHTSI